MCTFVRTYKRSTTIGKIKIIELKDKERLQLEEGFRRGKSHSFRMRCRAILLKSNGLTSKDVGIQTEMTDISVNSWVKRFECEGVTGLASSRGNGSDLWIISIQTPYSMPPTEPWRQSGLDSKSILNM